jgi:hypothetical protein
MTDTMPDDTDTAAGRAEELRALRDKQKLSPAEPDPGKQPVLPYYERHPEHRPRRRSWRRTIRQRLSEA